MEKPKDKYLKLVTSDRSKYFVCYSKGIGD